MNSTSASLPRRLILLIMLFAARAQAHHGLDFMVLQDGTIPKPFSVMLFDNTEWSSTNSAEEWGTEPGIHMGLTPWLAIGTTASIMDEGNGWHYLSTTPYLNLPIFNSERLPWLQISLYAGYEFPDNVASAGSRGSSSRQKQTAKNNAASTQAAASSSSKITSSSGGKQSLPRDPRVQRHTTGGTGGTGPDAPTGGGGTVHDHPVGTAPAKQSGSAIDNAPQTVFAAPVQNEYLGIHRHGEEGLHARLIIDTDLGDKDKIIANIINFTPRIGQAAWGYAIGYRHAFTHDLAASLEAIGDFDGRGAHEALLAAHCTVSHAVTLKLGVGTGFTESSPDISVHAGMVWRF